MTAGQSEQATEGRAVLDKAFATVNSVYDSGDFDPYELYAECRETMPVMDGDLLARYNIPSQADFMKKGRRIKTLFRYEDVTRVLREQETFSAFCMLEGFGQFLGDIMLTGFDGVQHRRLRNLMQPAFGISLLRKWEPMIREIMLVNYIEPMLPGGKADLVSEFSVPFPVRVIYDVMGFPTDIEATQKFAGLALTILSGFEADPSKANAAAARAGAASEELFNHVLPIVRKRRADGAQGEDMIAHLLRAEEEGASLTDEQVTNVVRMMLTAATETTTRAFGNMMIHLISRPELIARIRGDRTLVPKAVSESLRYDTVSAFLARVAVKDTEIAGVPIPAGTALSLATGSANRDSATFVDGDTYNIDRPLKPNISFGSGVHTCLGMPVARIELESALNVILDTMPHLRFDPDAPASTIRGLQLRGPDTLHVRWG